jgi:hypothetical protein
VSLSRGARSSGGGALHDVRVGVRRFATATQGDERGSRDLRKTEQVAAYRALVGALTIESDGAIPPANSSGPITPCGLSLRVASHVSRRHHRAGVDLATGLVTGPILFVLKIRLDVIS